MCDGRAEEGEGGGRKVEVRGEVVQDSSSEETKQRAVGLSLGVSLDRRACIE